MRFAVVCDTEEDANRTGEMMSWSLDHFLAISDRFRWVPTLEEAVDNLRQLQKAFPNCNFSLKEDTL